MRRGEVWTVELEPVRGSEADKTRPAVIVSNDTANATAERLRRGTITVVPVTTNTRHVTPFQVLLPAAACGLTEDSKAQAEQVRAVTFERIRTQCGALPPALLKDLDSALRVHLDL